MNGIYILGGFNQNQIRYIFQGFGYGIMNGICGYSLGRRRGVEEGAFNLGFPLRMFQVYTWGDAI